MRLLLIGAPGAGKGTQAERLAERFGLAHISSGDLLRQHVKDETALGRTIKSYVDAGDLVPDAVVMDMLRKPVVAAVEDGGYVLDGFPRTVDQAKPSFPTARALGAEVQAAIHLDVPREELVGRLLARQRGSDDTQAVIEHRLQVYLDNTRSPPPWWPRARESSPRTRAPPPCPSGSRPPGSGRVPTCAGITASCCLPRRGRRTGWPA